jgi:hypothetical protein
MHAMKALGHHARTHSARGHEQNARNSRGLRETDKSLRMALAGAALVAALPGTAGAQALVSNLAPAVAALAQNAPAGQPTPSIAFTQNAPVPQPPLTDQGGFLTRLVNAYVDEWDQSVPTNPADQTNSEAGSARRQGYPPAPLNSPPWAWTDWPIGGTALLGGASPNADGGNLMKALGGTSVGDWMKDNHIEIWGWLDGGFNISTSHGQNGNAPAGYDFNANTAQLNQAVVYIERVPDTVQTDHLDWGFRIVGLYGTDYREVTMQGLFSDQLTRHNNLYGWTPTNFYYDLYIPWVGEGSNFRVGRYTTLGDIEADLDLQNVFDSHSLYYTYDPFTQFGGIWSTRLTKNWTVQAGINAGSDVAPWENDAKPTVTGCVQWTSDSSWDAAYLCANGTNDGKYAFNNVNLYQFMGYHKITDRLWVATEDYYEYEKSVPAVGQATIAGANPTICNTGVACWAGSYAISFYIMYQLSDRDYIGLRNEGYDDVRGQRTGFATWYTENTLGYVHWLSPSVEVRPEIRFDHSYAAAAYDNGTRRNQFTFASDIVIKF